MRLGEEGARMEGLDAIVVARQQLHRLSQLLECAGTKSRKQAQVFFQAASGNSGLRVGGGERRKIQRRDGTATEWSEDRFALRFFYLTEFGLGLNFLDCLCVLF